MTRHIAEAGLDPRQNQEKQMASVWYQYDGMRQPRKLAGHLDKMPAIAFLRQRAQAWVARAPGRKAAAPSDIEYLLYEPGDKIASASLFVEPCSPPSAPDWDNRRGAKPQEKA